MNRYFRAENEEHLHFAFWVGTPHPSTRLGLTQEKRWWGNTPGVGWVAAELLGPFGIPPLASQQLNSDWYSHQSQDVLF